MRSSVLPAEANSGAPLGLPIARGWLARLLRALNDEVKYLNIRLVFVNSLVRLLPALSFCRVRTALYRFAGVRIGPRSLIFGRLGFTGSPPLPTRLHIGADTMINEHCFVDLNAEVHIGDRVSIGHHITFVTADHEVGPAACRAGAMRPKPIVVDDGCWIGARCTLLPGVHIGKSSVVAAGSLVSGDVPANRLVGGVPARAIRSLPSEP